MSNFDIVHTHSVFLWPTWAAARIARRMKVPYVLAPRGMLVRELIRRKSRWLKRAWISLVERANISNASLLHFTSDLEAEEAAAMDLPIGHSCVVPNGLDLPSHGDVPAPLVRGPAGDEVPFLLFLGRINWKKGLDRLIAALPGIPGCRLVIAGNDEEGYWPRLQALAVEAGVGERISFVGPVYGQEKQELFRHALMLVLPSYSENFGNVVLEAMAAGCPVVVTPEVGAAELVRESRGGVVIPGDPQVLGAGISRLMSDPEELRRAGQRGREFVFRNCTWDAVALHMEDAYRKVLSEIQAARNG